MVLLLWLAAPLQALAQLGTDPTDHIEVVRAERMLSLDWSDAEDVLRGGIVPTPLSAGKPFTVSLRIQPVSGQAPTTLPVVITLRRTGEEQGASQVVTAKNGTWIAHFTPEHAGPYLLDVSFRTTHPKVLHAGLSVRPRPVPAWAWALLGVLAVGGGFEVWRRRRQEVRLSSESAQ